MRTLLFLGALLGLAPAAQGLSVLDGPRETPHGWAFVVVDDGRGLALLSDAPLRATVAAPGDAHGPVSERRSWAPHEVPRGVWQGVPNATRIVVAPERAAWVVVAEQGEPAAGWGFHLLPLAEQPAASPQDAPAGGPASGPPPDDPPPAGPSPTARADATRPAPPPPEAVPEASDRDPRGPDPRRLLPIAAALAALVALGVWLVRAGPGGGT